MLPKKRQVRASAATLFPIRKNGTEGISTSQKRRADVMNKASENAQDDDDLALSVSARCL